MRLETFDKAKSIVDQIEKCDQELENINKLIVDPNYRKLMVGRYGYSDDHIIKCPSFTAQSNFVKNMLAELTAQWLDEKERLLTELEKL